MTHDNPYATDTDSSTGYYKSVIGNATFAEIRDIMGGTLPAIIVSLLNLFRRVPKAAYGFANELQDVALDDIPVAIRKQLQGTFNDLEAAGFELAFALKLSTVGPVLGYNVVFSHPDATCWASVLFTHAAVGGASQTENGLVVASMTTSGGFVSTTNIRRRLRGPDNLNAAYLSSKSNTRVIDTHRNRIKEFQIAEVRRGEVPEIVRRISAENAEFNIQRGVLVRLTPEELEQLDRQVDCNRL